MRVNADKVKEAMEASPPYVLRYSRHKDVLYILYHLAVVAMTALLLYLISRPIAHGQNLHWLLAFVIKAVFILLAFRLCMVGVYALVTLIFKYIPRLLRINVQEIILEKEHIILRSKRGEYKHPWKELKEFTPHAWECHIGLPSMPSNTRWYLRIIGFLVMCIAMQFEVVTGDRVEAELIFQTEEEESEAADHGYDKVEVENIVDFNAVELTIILNHWRNQALAAAL